MLFADDAALCACANSEQELQVIVSMLRETFKAFGHQLAILIEKTEVMMQKATPDKIWGTPNIFVEGQLLHLSLIHI